MKIRDKVIWETRGRSRITYIRSGVIVARVPPFADPWEFGPIDLPRLPVGERRRAEQSYLVLSEGTLYWPFTEKLKLEEEYIREKSD